MMRETDVRVAAMSQDIQALRATVEQLTSTLSDMELVGTTLKNENSMLKSQVNIFQQALTRAEETVTAKTAEIANLSASSAAAAQETARAKEQLEHLSATLAAERSRHEQEIEDLKLESRFAIQSAEDAAQATIAKALAQAKLQRPA